jgi:hypothetical protein
MIDQLLIITPLLSDKNKRKYGYSTDPEGHKKHLSNNVQKYIG